MKLVNFLFFLIVVNSFSQQKMNIYYSENKYNEEVKNILQKNEHFIPYNLLIQYYIDRKNEGIIDLESIKKQLEKKYPNVNGKGVLCLNVENQLFKDLQIQNSGLQYKNALNEFKKMIKFVKCYRPNVEVGIYGLPYRVYYESQLKWNKNKKFDALLKEVDIIFPSLYILYPKKQTSIASNINYLEKNLKEALNYGARFNKKVIPFFDYKVHFANKNFGNELLPFDEVKQYLRFIENYRYKNKKVEGIVWWELNQNLFSKSTKIPYELSTKEYIIDQNYLIKKYLSNFIKQ